MKIKNIFLYILLLSTLILSQTNPWIKTTEIIPINTDRYLVGFGPGNTVADDNEYDDRGLITFKYAFLSQTSKNSYSGYSISGYSQGSGYVNWESCFYYGDYCKDESTTFLFAYTHMKALKSSDNFEGIFYGYDVGLTFAVYEEFLFGLTLEPIKAFFNKEDRSKIRLGINTQIGYSLKNILISLQSGFNSDNNHISINVSYWPNKK